MNRADSWVNTIAPSRVRQLLQRAAQVRILVIGDVMLDHFIWGRVVRISPEAPVPVVEFERESFMPGGAANVARNLTSLNVTTDLAGVIGQDNWGQTLTKLLRDERVGCENLVTDRHRPTSLKTRIIAHQQQVVRVDRETNEDLARGSTRQLVSALDDESQCYSAVILGDYGKGVITQELLDEIKRLCRSRGLWLSLDPKPVHRLNLAGLSLITPNRKEAFELAGMPDGVKRDQPLEDQSLLRVSEILLSKLQPALLLITLGDQGMLLCRRDQKPFHIPTMAQEVFDVSGAGDTVIASFTLAIAAGASPIEAAVFSNHAAGVVVGKVGTAIVRPDELLASFKRQP
jgi:D-beta-D-heptose 7-phosphate kinase/D-beta-D-heptose 1-phosphate adenosyltransferase